MDLPIFKKPLPKRERFSNNEERFQDGKEKLLDLAYDSDSDSQSYGRYHAAPPANTTHKSVKSIVSVMPKAKICLTSPSETDQQDSKSKNFSSRQSRIPRRPQSFQKHGDQKNVSFEETPKNNVGSLFDSQYSRKAPKTAESAREWFQKLRDLVADPIISVRRQQGDKLVKVAVLDTGIDISHPMITEAIKQNDSKITKFQDWIQSPFGIGDRVSHGTAVCEILLKVAKVDLYVGKVSDTPHFNDDTPGIVKQAIEHAVPSSGWDVDIIVLSLGFESEDQGIRKAIWNAYTRNKIIFAAASNSGSLVPDIRVSFPGRMHGQVISIRSASGQSVRSNASPTPSAGDDNFMVLGEGIKAAWPIELNNGHHTRYVSRTSFATPIAAGIAALVLEFSIQERKGMPNVTAEGKGILWTHRRIRRIFHKMSTIDDQLGNSDCRMIYPWGLFDSERKYLGHGIEIDRLLKSI